MMPKEPEKAEIDIAATRVAELGNELEIVLNKLASLRHNANHTESSLRYLSRCIEQQNRAKPAPKHEQNAEPTNESKRWVGLVLVGGTLTLYESPEDLRADMVKRGIAWDQVAWVERTVFRSAPNQHTTPIPIHRPVTK
jgi:hypothetical protein